MVLNNYWKVKRAVDNGEFYYAAGTGTIDLGIYNLSGTAVTLMRHLNTAANCYNIALKASLSVRVGTGTTAPTLSDYALANDITANITSFSASANLSFSDGQEVLTITFSGTNNTGSAINISEVGLYKSNFYASNSQYQSIMLVREVLDTPITVPAGEGFSKTFTWTEGITASTSSTRNALNLEKGTVEKIEEKPVEEKKEVDEKSEELTKEVDEPLDEEEPEEPEEEQEETNER